MGTPVTRLWHIDEKGRRRLYATIDYGSGFHGFKAPPDLHLESQRTKCAEIIRDGWINQGGVFHGVWEIEQGTSDPKEFSKMTQEMIMKGREEFGV